MTVVVRYYPLIDPANGENDRNIGPGLTIENLTNDSITHLALGIISLIIQRRFYCYIRRVDLKLLYKISIIVLTGLFYLLHNFREGAIKLCEQPRLSLCVNSEINQFNAQRACFVYVAIEIFLIYLLNFGILGIICLGGRELNELVTIEEIRSLGSLLSGNEIARMDLVQFSEALRFFRWDIITFSGAYKNEFADRINSLRGLSEEAFTSIFSAPQGRDFVRDYPRTCAAYRTHLPERLRHLERLLDPSHQYTVEHEPPTTQIISESGASSSSPMQIRVIPQIESQAPNEFRALLDDMEACRSYISQTGFTSTEDQTITAHILHMSPLLISLLSPQLALNVISYFVEIDLIEDVKTLLEHRPDVEKMDLSSLILTAAHHNRTNILKYLLSKIPNDRMLSSLMEEHIKKASPHNDQEVMNDIFERLIDLPEEFYPHYNVLSTRQIAAQFRAFIKKTFDSLSSDHFDSIKQVICLIRYFMHLINHHELENGEISPHLTVTALLTTLSEYIHNISGSEPIGKVENHLYFARGHLPKIWEFFQTGRKYQIPDENFPELFESIEADINKKLQQERM